MNRPWEIRKGRSTDTDASKNIKVSEERSVIAWILKGVVRIWKNYRLVFDRQPWWVNHPSPTAKWLHNFCQIGLLFKSDWIAWTWFFLFNPAMMILYMTIGLIVLFLIYFN